MKLLKRLENKYGKRRVYGSLGICTILLILGGYFLFSGGDSTTDTVTSSTKQVSVEEAGTLGQEAVSLRTIGTVRAISEARLQTESSGRVTSVAVRIGDSVSAGTILASIENSRERAALLQAEGAYESTLAGNAQSEISLREAEISAENTYRTSYTIADDAIRNLTDELFSNPNSSNPGPGLRLNSQGSAGNLNDERIEIGNILEKWQASLNTTSLKNHVALLDAAEKDLTQISTFVSEISRLMSEQDPDAVFTEEVIASYKSRFLGARSRVDSAIQSISSTRNVLLSATQSTQGTGVASSETDARIKQALGSLRAAQAAYEKTLVRSPISGVVNAFYLRANEYVGMSTPAAVIANNGALEITTSVSEEERALVTVGNPVDISTGDTTIRGSVTRIAPALDPLSGKIEVKVSVNEENVSLENGGTVSLSLLSGTTTPSADLKIPLRALKITAEGPVAFTVSENNTLVSQPVTLGAILGDLVIIKSGIEKNTRIVTDARGLKEGDAVTIN